MTRRLAFMLAVALGACGGSSANHQGSRVDYAATVTVRSPQLVSIGPELYVLADADEPVFYTDSYYWLYKDSRWHRSRSYDRGFVVVETAPSRLRQIDEPTAYVRYSTRTQEARRKIPIEPYYEDRNHSDAVGPHQQPPVAPTEPERPMPPYPRPPQQESPVDPAAPGTPASPGTPGQLRDDRAAPTSPHQTPPRPDDRPVAPPGQVKQDDGQKMPEGHERDGNHEPGKPGANERKPDKSGKHEAGKPDKPGRPGANEREPGKHEVGKPDKPGKPGKPGKPDKRDKPAEAEGPGDEATPKKDPKRDY